MREIVYFYIADFRNIHNQGFNFGSEYEYYTENIDKKIIVKRRKNDFYIHNFFQTENSNSIINISAIVGENGAGKSNFIDALKSALTQDRDWFNYLLVYKDANRNVYCDNSEHFNVEYDFEQSEGTPAFTDVIYYNPSLDNKIYPITHDNNAWVDISTDWLLYNDFDEQKSTKPNLSQIELFNSEEIERQLKLSNDLDFVDFLNNKINLPTEIRIVSVAGDFPSKIDGIKSSVRNVPYNYRNYYDLFNDMGMIVNQYATEEHKIQVERKIPDDINPFTRKKCFATFLDHLLKNLFYHFERTNHYLDKGKITISLDDLKKLEYEEAVYTFINNIDLIDNTEAIINFVKYTENLILNARVEFSNYGEISWISPKESLKDFLSLKDKYLEQLSKFSDYSVPRFFIGYSWTGLSTGEKAMFNLFSRFFFAKSKIIENVNKERFSKKKIPNMLYILIDEAELGFHLQWQKEYVHDIIEYLPKTLVFDTENGKLYPKIQIIFTTHSTLTLSDIPNTHISYIKNQDKKAYVLTNEEKPRKSFGANVHTLMSDSFFLRNGLVGSFAIKKINEIVAILNSEKPTQEEIEKVKAVIQIIDEPVLKIKLQSMLSKFDNSSEYEVKRLEQQKEEIENRIKKLKGND
jgi:AAA15 family ATPase/GTPase